MDELPSDRLAVLRKVDQLLRSEGRAILWGEVQGHFPAEQRDNVDRNLHVLGDEAYIEADRRKKGDGQWYFLRVVRVTKKGQWALGAWPDA